MILGLRISEYQADVSFKEISLPLCSVFNIYGFG